MENGGDKVYFKHYNVRVGMAFEEFLRILFPNQKRYRVVAGLFLKSLHERGSLDGYELAKLCRDNNIPKSTMHNVFVKLRDLGLVERRHMRYYLSNEFSYALRRLGDAWKRFRERGFEFEPLLMT